MSDIFCFKTEIWVPIYTGIKVESLQQFIQALKGVSCGTLIYHFYINLFNYHNLPTDYNNSFAYWLASSGYESIAEKIASIDPTNYYDLEILRTDILNLLSETQEEKPERFCKPFYFISVYREVIDTKRCTSTVEEFIKGVEESGISSIFYHLITSKIEKKSVINDYSEWLLRQGYAKKADAISTIDIYASNLYEIKNYIVEVLKS